MTDLNAGRTDADHYDAEDLTVYLKNWEIDQETVAKFKHGFLELKRFFDKNSL